jgi:hypothetical protein
MLDAAFYDLLMEASNAIAQAMATARTRLDAPTEPRPPILALRAGYAESPGWFLVQAAESAPEPLTVDLLRVRDTYASERLVQGLLELLASEGWLQRDAADRYALTGEGWAVMHHSRERMRRLLAELAPLTPAATGQLMGLVERLIGASLASPTPPGTWCLAHSRRRAPAEDAPALMQLLQYFDDFNAFRDDAHMAAWQPYEPHGATWEAFALVCGGEATDAATVAEQLARRGYSPAEYAVALASLTERGWLAEGDLPASYQVTAQGRDVRETVEQQTDAYFYAPWSCLSDAEIATLADLLRQFQVGLAP